MKNSTFNSLLLTGCGLVCVVLTYVLTLSL